MPIDQITSASLASGVPTRAQLPAGSVLQVVSAGTSSEVFTTAQNTWVSSGLSATITPSSANSRILILASQNIGMDGGFETDQQVNLSIFRDSTLIFGVMQFDDLRMNPIADATWRAGLSFLDSPATTSAVTYTTRGSMRLPASGSTMKMQYSGVPSSMVLLEIAG
jgi:hypothetical protein